jgi:hypothetical protein
VRKMRDQKMMSIDWRWTQLTMARNMLKMMMMRWRCSHS